MTTSGSPPGSDGATDRILTVPNALSLGRLACIPVFLWLLFAEQQRVAAAWLLAFLGATDWVDGYVARRFNQVSNLGKVLDPVADRLLLGVAVVAILVEGSVPTLVAWLAITREALVSVAAIVLAALGARRIDVSREGKFGTAGLIISFPLFLVSGGDGIWATVAWIAAVVGLSFGWYAAVMYVPQGRRALAEGRAST